jgi:UrcA family protein
MTKTQTFRRFSGAVLALTMMAALPGVDARAAGPEAESATASRQVSLAGLDLTTREGQAALRRRVVAAAVHVCEDTTFSVSANASVFLECFRKARAEAMAAADSRIAAANTPATFAGGRF